MNEGPAGGRSAGIDISLGHAPGIGHLLRPVADTVIEPVKLSPGTIRRSEEFAWGVAEGFVRDRREIAISN